ncbi:hypothetical protein ALC57_01542 [Trachymyrmex cornetzi]|uniref:Uncharacterized protein n=1 Tax=Trachymyrmex cornetzi TaxID=471704 RepID=A0A151JPH4_9HYME|nr:hypothetical protein ALC57_01542 [Trachymyrmex cornetzi]
MPSGTTTNVQLDVLARRMRVPYFREVFMRNVLPTSGVRRNGSGIVNLDDATRPGTDWVAYAKRNNRVVYFDSFGNLQPLKEVVRYFGNGVTVIEYNRTSYQTYDQSFYGQICLWFLRTVDAREFKKLDEVP